MRWGPPAARWDSQPRNPRDEPAGEVRRHLPHPPTGDLPALSSPSRQVRTLHQSTSFPLGWSAAPAVLGAPWVASVSETGCAVCWEETRKQGGRCRVTEAWSDPETWKSCVWGGERTHPADSCAAEPQQCQDAAWGFGVHCTFQPCSCDGWVAGYPALGAAGNPGLTRPPQNPDGWIAPLKTQGATGTAPQKPWAMWGLPRGRTRGPGVVLGLLPNQAGSPKLSN